MGYPYPKFCLCALGRGPGLRERAVCRVLVYGAYELEQGSFKGFYKGFSFRGPYYWEWDIRAPFPSQYIGTIRG